jgi:RNA polymerase sigma-54 factor
LSIRNLHQALRDIVEGEDKKKPFSDDALVDLLKQQGYDVARRTVAKYREHLGIPTSRMRRK